MSESGSIHPYGLGFSALLAVAILVVSVAGSALVANQRLQGIADLALGFAHQESWNQIEEINDQEIREQLNHYLRIAHPDLKLNKLQLQVSGYESRLVMCAGFTMPFVTQFSDAEITSCVESKAATFDPRDGSRL